MKLITFHKPYIAMVILENSIDINSPEDLHIEHNTLYCKDTKIAYCLDERFLIEIRNTIVTALKEQNESFYLNAWADHRLKEGLE